MSKVVKPLSIIVVGILLAGGAALFMSKQSGAPEETSAAASATTPVPQGGGRTRGPQNAPVTLVEFGDYQCPSCGYYAPIVLEVLKRYPQQVRLEFHHFPLVGIHQWAMPAALASEAAGEQGKFWEMHDLLYENQEKWSKSQNAEAEFVAYATQLGLNVNRFMQSMRDPVVQQRILEDVKRATDGKINETPTFFINGEKVTQKPGNPDEFSQLIQSKLPK
jgi:protein-disulfide isomerase